MPFAGGELRIRQPAEAAELPDDHQVEWAPLAPYWSVLWRSGAELAREVAATDLDGLRVVELGCGLGLPSIAAARTAAQVVATDACDEPLELLKLNAADNGVQVDTAQVEWDAADELVASGPFDLVLASDVLYVSEGVELLLKLLPRLGREVWIADPGRTTAAEFFERAAPDWQVEASNRGVVTVYRLRPA